MDGFISAIRKTCLKCVTASSLKAAPSTGRCADMSHGHHTIHHAHQKDKAHERRLNQEMPVEDYFHGKRVYYDAKEDINVVKIFAGDWHVSAHGNEMLATILGSCVSACIRDPALRIGGMNHFLLPGDEA